MNPILLSAAVVTAIGTIGSGALYLDHAHVAAEDFKEYIDQRQAADEAEYVLALKKEIRAVRSALRLHPDDEYLNESLAGLMAELCETRPDDTLCGGGP